METIGFVIAIVEARSIINTIQTRIQNYRQGQAVFQTLKTELKSLEKLSKEVERLLKAAPIVLPTETYEVLKTTCFSVRDGVDILHKTLKEITPTLGGSSSGVMGKLKSGLRLFFRTHAFTAKMDTVETQVKYYSSQLLHLITALTAVIKTHETRDILLSKMEDLNIVENSDPVYCRPGTNAPASRHTVILKFDVRDADGKLETPEGKLKNSVLSRLSSTEVTVAAGVMEPAYGIVGMAGVGKTIALQGLAYDKDVQKHFVDGVLYMSLGKGATLQKVISQIGRIMNETGARVSENSTSLGAVVDEAIAWFSGKICLFLVDDLWPTPTCEMGYLRELQQLMRDSPRSRMAITTRSLKIAQYAGSVVLFGAHDPTGSVSEAIFMKYATVSVPPEAWSDLDPEVRISVSKILSLCGGLPIALAVTGSGVANLASLHGDFKTAAISYAMQLENKVISLGEEEIPGCTSLNAGIILSLECLAEKWKLDVELEVSVRDLYVSLCVLENQTWIPVSVLSRLWQLDEASTLNVAEGFCEMSLASLSSREQDNGSSKCGLELHDLQLDFCQRYAKKNNTWSQWHAQLLRGYLTEALDASVSSLQDLALFKPRQWFSEKVPEDDYIHLNLARHLVSSGLGVELASLLLDARWMHLRVRIGGILALKADFEHLNNFMGQPGSTEGRQSFSPDIKEGFDLILKALELSWGSAAEGERALLFQLCGRLHTSRTSNEIADKYLKSVEVNTKKPYLLPVNSFFPELYRALIMELRLQAPVTRSPCGHYIAALDYNDPDIVVARANSGDILQRLKGHTNWVESMTFSEESSKIVSGSWDKTVTVWEWKKADSPVQVLKGHSNIVTCVAVSSDDQRIYSGSEDGTLRVWDANNGTQKVVIQAEESSKAKPIFTLALCAKGRIVALGLWNGALKVVDTDTGETVFEDAHAHEKTVKSMALSPSGTVLATGSSDCTIRLWDTETWTGIGQTLEGHKDAVASVAFSPDGQRLVSGSWDGCIRVWSVGTRKTIGVSPNLKRWVTSVVFTSDGKRIIAGYGADFVRIWDAQLDAKSEQREYGHSEGVLSVAISHDGTRVVSGSKDKTLRLWNAQTGEQVGLPLEGHTAVVDCLSFSPDGRQVVSGSDDGTVRLWDTNTFAQIGGPLRDQNDWVRCVSFSSDGLRIVSSSYGGTARVWNVETRELIGGTLEGGSQNIDDLAESFDGFHVVARASTSRDSESIIWNRERGAIVWRSKGDEISSGNEINDEEAKVIIRSCGQETQRVWPEAFPKYTREVSSSIFKCDVHSNANGEKILLGTLPSRCYCWRYDPKQKLYAAGLRSGAVAICKLIE